MKHVFLASLLFAVVASVAGVAAEPYDGFANDQSLIQKYNEARRAGKGWDETDSKAAAAAHRAFANVSFLFRKRAEVLQILGEPHTTANVSVSVDGKLPAGVNLIYRFENGYGGWEFRLRLEGDRVVAVEVSGID